MLLNKLNYLSLVSAQAACHTATQAACQDNSHNPELFVQDEAEWHQADSEQYEAEGEGDLYEFGQECLDRIALALGGKTMVPLAEQALPQLMTDHRWQQRHAALICLAQIAEGCAKVMLQNKQVTGLVQMCKQVSMSWAEPLSLSCVYAYPRSETWYCKACVTVDGSAYAATRPAVCIPCVTAQHLHLQAPCCSMHSWQDGA